MSENTERESLFDPERLETRQRTWEIVAANHKEQEQWTAARLASDVADAMRFYRLHMDHLEGRDNG